MARRTPRLRRVLLLVNLVVVLVPLAGIWGLRLYEQMLVQQTEGELLAQGAVVVAVYRDALQRHLQTIGVTDYGPEIDPVSLASRSESSSRGERYDTGVDPESPLSPAPPTIDLTTEEVRPPAPDARRPGVTLDPAAKVVGAAMMGILDDARRVTLAGIRVLDIHGIVVASTGAELGMDLSHREEVGRALDGERISLLRRRVRDEPGPAPWSIQRGAKIRVFVALPVVEDGHLWGVVVLSRTPLSIWQGLWRIRWQLVLGALLTLSVVLFVSAVTSRRVSRPIGALIRQADAVVGGDLKAAQPLKKPGTREIAQLSTAVSAMAQSLEERADYIRMFAANVSHEFKTPLTSIQGTVELLRDHLHTMTDAERTRFLDILRADTKRLDRLVRRLLELARADVARPEDISTEVVPLAERVAARFRDAGLDVRLTSGDDVAAARVKMLPEMLDSVLNHVLENAQQHAGVGALVLIHISRVDRHLEIAVSDSGTGISEANLKRIRRPFFTTARDRGGSGLGLSIVESLIRAHGGILTVESHAGHGTRIGLRLPLEPTSASG